jgi:hypothetical protein
VEPPPFVGRGGEASREKDLFVVVEAAHAFEPLENGALS